MIEDPLAPARGCGFGLLIACPLWAVLFTLAWIVSRVLS